MSEIYNSDRTASILLDIGAKRAEEERKIEEMGLGVTAKDLADGLKPEDKGKVTKAILAVILNPSWANTLGAVVTAAMTEDPKKPDLLRDDLIAVASVAVAWIEVLDERKELAKDA